MASDKQDPQRVGVRDFQVIRGNGSRNKVASHLVAGTVAQLILATAAVIAVLYVAALPMVTLLASAILAFALDPFVDWLERTHVPRWLGSLLAVLLLLGLAWGLGYISYNRAVDFVNQLPKYKQRIEQSTSGFWTQAKELRTVTSSLATSSSSNSETSAQGGGLAQLISRGASGFGESLFAATFVPFLIYFMLSWKRHTRSVTVRLFAPANRKKARQAIDSIAEIFRAFIAGNLLCGVFMTLVSTGVFWALGLPYFYFLGILSGFFSLVPYLGVLLGILPPLAAGFGQLSGGKIIAIAVFTAGLHVVAINVLMPKVVGHRLNLNPLVVTIALLVWGWIWGAMGLLLAIPATGALKTICDHVDSLKPIGAWMED